jgi:hypothetical protein
MTVRRFFSYLLLVIGVLIAVTTGLCTLIGLAAIGSDPGGLLMVLVIGGLPCLIGAGLAALGWRLVRAQRDG